MTQTGPLGQVSSNISSGCNLSNEANKGQMPLEMDAIDSSLDPFNKLTIPNQFSASFPNVTRESIDLVMENSSKVEGDSLSDIFKSSRIGNSSATQPFDDADLDYLVFNQQVSGLSSIQYR